MKAQQEHQRAMELQYEAEAEEQKCRNTEEREHHKKELVQQEKDYAKGREQLLAQAAAHKRAVNEEASIQDMLASFRGIVESSKAEQNIRVKQKAKRKDDTQQTRFRNSFLLKTDVPDDHLNLDCAQAL
jgi:hypothetical protein